MKLFARGAGCPPQPPESPRADVDRARALIEESREIVIVLDESRRVVTASRRARESLDGLVEGSASG